ncbi:MAG TPA: sulfatase-like hydrolase/transferase, partial [Vicinamibacterales bacterium]|nr:sulfatase-like hydrolase/transferase [Vicinamibacterales bacterium]
MIAAARRVTVIGFCWLTAAYAWLAASPFSYQEFIRPKMFGTGVFGPWHAAFYWMWLACAAIELRDAGSGRTGSTVERRRPTVATNAFRAFVIFWVIVGVRLTVVPVLPRLRDDNISIFVGIVALAPVVWLSVLAHARTLGYLRAQRPGVSDDDRAALDGRWFLVAIGAGVFVALASGALTPIAMRGEFEPDLLTLGLSVGLAWNAVYHAAIFCAAFLSLMVLVRATSGLGFVTQYAGVAALVTAILAVLVRRTVCDALGFDARTGAVVAIAAAVAIAASWTQLRLERWSAIGARLTSALDLFFAPAPESPLDVKRLAASLAALAALAYGIGAASRIIDWDFLMLKVGVVVLWIATFDRLARVTPRLRLHAGVIALGCAVPLALWAVDARVQKWMPSWLGDPVFSIRRVLDRYAVYNAPFRVADAVMRPPAPEASAFDRFVRARSGLASYVPINPVAQDFVLPLAAAPKQPPPNIFVFVLDSLRPDYVSPYNPVVTFSPRIAEFARESVVFRNAFTKFGGTGLSLPSIWTGAVGVHKQYVKPFWPMNTLEKLLNANRYHRVMSVDVIMEPLLLPNPSTTELDRGVRTMDYELCRTLDEMQQKFPASDAAPVFGYSLPQDLHVSNIMTASVPPGESYPGFHAPYAARVRKVDRCFGQFIDFLKRRGVYDRSIVVLTADHGEMLGEDGRWGHAYFMFPPILTVPLIVHLPSDLRVQTVDLGAISFLTDLSPTFYASLGYRPKPSNPLMGEPLLGPDAFDPAARRRGVYVLAASYSAVYASVRRNGHRVYIADAVKGEDYAYDRDASGVWHSVSVSDGR